MKELFRAITHLTKTPNEIWKDSLSLPARIIIVSVVGVDSYYLSNVILSNFNSYSIHIRNTILKFLIILKKCHGIVYKEMQHSL
jgi:hypothetical protein